MPRISKEKQEEILKRMQETRKGDTMFLRQQLEAKLEWAKSERVKGMEVIQRQLKQIQENKEIVSKLDTIISFVEEILHTKKEEMKEEQ